MDKQMKQLINNIKANLDLILFVSYSIVTIAVFFSSYQLYTIPLMLSYGVFTYKF